VEVARLRALESQDLRDGSALEPRVLLEGQEQLTLIEQQPDAMLGDVGYRSLRSGRSGNSGLLLALLPTVPSRRGSVSRRPWFRVTSTPSADQPATRPERRQNQRRTGFSSRPSHSQPSVLSAVRRSLT